MPFGDTCRYFSATYGTFERFDDCERSVELSKSTLLGRAYQCARIESSQALCFHVTINRSTTETKRCR